MIDAIDDDPFALLGNEELEQQEMFQKQSGEIAETSDSQKDRLEVSNIAKAKILALLAGRSEGSFFRVQVRGGGCSGYQVSFVVDNVLKSNDILLEDGNMRVVIDTLALSLARHAIVDYQEDFSGSFFHLVVPNSVAQCGCGESFAL